MPPKLGTKSRMLDNDQVLAQAEAIARDAKRDDTDRIVRACEESDNSTLRSLARVYRMLNGGF